MSHQDQVEFTLWLRENQSAFLKAAKVICFDTQNAEDVLQEALADVYKRWSKIRDHENPEGYLMRVMVSKHADMRRKWLRKQEERETSWDLAENIRDIADSIAPAHVQPLLVIWGGTPDRRPDLLQSHFREPSHSAQETLVGPSPNQ